MCLAVPGRVMQWIDRDPTFAKAEVEFDGIRRVCHMACVLEAALGDYVVVHAGIAISRINPWEAQRLIEDLIQLGHMEDFTTEIDPISSEPKGAPE